MGHVLPVDPERLEMLAAVQQVGGSWAAPDGADVPPELRAKYERAVARLEPFERDIWMMRYGWGMLQRGIAAVFGMTQATISNRLSRARWRVQVEMTLPPVPESVDEWHRDLDPCLAPLVAERRRRGIVDMDPGHTVELLHAACATRSWGRASEVCGIAAGAAARGLPPQQALYRARNLGLAPLGVLRASPDPAVRPYVAWFDHMAAHRLWGRLAPSTVMASHRAEKLAPEHRRIRTDGVR